MPTCKKRINITVDDDLYAALERLSTKRHKSVSHMSLTLIEFALALQEDMHFARVADDRLEKKERRLTHDQVWDP